MSKRNTVSEPEPPTYSDTASRATRSWYAVAEAARGNLLLGGVKRHESVRFSTQSMAALWLSIVIEENAKLGREIASALIIESQLDHEVS
jgi:hypothetical protein